MNINAHKRSIFPFILSLFLSFAILHGQSTLAGFELDVNTTDGWLIELSDETSSESVSRSIQNIGGQYIDIQEFKPIYKRNNIYVLKFGSASIENQMTVLEQIKEQKLIETFHQNRQVSLRSKNPNDPLFVEQWNMMRIQMPLAWETTTGGVTATGDTIVVAILDTGYDLTHPDLISNYYYNHDEIPGDGEDNDMNGYEDDYLGLNIREGNDDHPDGAHGASVCGIIGAKGNNEKNVAGVNWNVKMMLISGIQSEGDIIEGYQYILDTRKAYNESAGQKGAFIVASNLSAGIDNAFAVDHPIWCNIYDDLGEVGVLNCGATTNKELDVEVSGDMPTTCTSDFLIAVTNTTNADEKSASAGYGPTSIDLGAPGSTTITTKLGGGTGGFPGTSAATPHVSGLIALMYAGACEEFLKKLKDNPKTGLLELKEMVLSSVDKLSGFDTLTVSGGRLNAFEAMSQLVVTCGGTVLAGESVWISKIMPNPAQGQMVVKFQTIFKESNHQFRIVDMLGRLVHSETIEANELLTNEISYDSRNLTTGMYYVLLGKGDVVAAMKFMVQ